MHRCAGDRALNVKPDEGVSPSEINDRRNLFGANKVTHTLDYSGAQIFLRVLRVFVCVCARAHVRGLKCVSESSVYACVSVLVLGVSSCVVCLCICLYVRVCVSIWCMAVSVRTHNVSVCM